MNVRDLVAAPSRFPVTRYGPPIGTGPLSETSGGFTSWQL